LLEEHLGGRQEKGRMRQRAWEVRRKREGRGPVFIAADTYVSATMTLPPISPSPDICVISE